MVTCGAIEHEGKIWLVPQWFEVPAKAVIKPRRIIPLDILQYQEMSPGSLYKVDFVVNDPLPKALFDETVPRQLKRRFRVVEEPGIEIATDDEHQQ